jgi:hypothetical protein
VKQEKPQFKNIVLQEGDGSLQAFESRAEGTNIILLVLQEEKSDMAKVMIRSAFTAHAGAVLVHQFLKDNPIVAQELAAVAMADMIEMVREAAVKDALSPDGKGGLN